MLVVVDTGPLFAVFNRADPYHQRAAALLVRTDVDFVVPALCIAEAAHLIAREMGPELEAQFIESCANLDVRHPEGDDGLRMAALMRQYAGFPLGTVDASVVALAERLDTRSVATFDHRHFRAIRPIHVDAFTLLP